jgi:hypothetical protein
MAISAVLDKAVTTGSRVFLSGSIVSDSKPDSLVLFGAVGADGRTITGSYSRSFPSGQTVFFLVLWIEEDAGILQRVLVPIKVGGVELTAIVSSGFGVWWEFGVQWSEAGTVILTLRDDRPRLMDVVVEYHGNPAMGELVQYGVPVRCKSTWSGTSLPSAPWGTFASSPLMFSWTTKALRPRPGDPLAVLYFRLEDNIRQRFYGCMVGRIGGVEMKNFKNLGSVANPWVVFEVRLDSDGNITNPREHDDRGIEIIVTPGK